MHDFIEKLQALSQRLKDALMDMSPRDRVLLAGMLVLFVAGGIGSTLWWMDSRVSDMERKIEGRKLTLTNIQTQLNTHRTAKAEVTALEQRLRSHSDSSLASFIERTSKSTKLDDRLFGVNSKQGARDADIETTRYAMTLKGLTLSELGDFIYAVETADYPVRIDTMKIVRSKKDDEIVLSPSLELSAFSIADSEIGSPQ